MGTFIIAKYLHIAGMQLEHVTTYIATDYLTSFYVEEPNEVTIMKKKHLTDLERLSLVIMHRDAAYHVAGEKLF